MNYSVKAISEHGTVSYKNELVTFKASKNSEEAFYQISFELTDWEEDAFVFAPACIYDGNKAKKVIRPYPPMFHEGEIMDDIILRGIPSLGEDGKDVAEFTVADMAAPIIGIFYKKKKEALFLYTEQQIKEKNIGFTLEAGKITVNYPTNRSVAYRFAKEPDKNPDKGISVFEGETITSRLLIRTTECEDILGFYDYFIRNRKLLLSSPRPENGYTDDLLRVMINHFNDHNYSGKYYGNTLHITWQAGWCGGGMSSYPLYVLGGEKEKERAIGTIDFMTDFVSPSGHLYSIIYKNDIIRDDSKYNALRSNETNENYKHFIDAHLVRRSGDVLIFLIKQFAVMPVKEKWVKAARGIADALVSSFKEYGTFGHYVNLKTGKLMIPRSCSGASAVAGLALAAKYFNEPEYLKIATLAGEYYFENFTKKGITYGGPGDNLCAADSESSYALVESFVILYEETKEKKWLDYASAAANQFSSWVMTYAFKFPADKEFGIIGINTTGSVFANVQNKHSAPGICTFSGDTLFRLYKYTNEPLYLELIKDVAHFMPQCVSRKERPIYDWDHEHGDPEGLLPEGYICERVNTSDWEYDKCVGGVFNVSCWCETSILLTFLELMNEPEMKD